MPYAVTGATGHVGGQVASALLDRGHAVRVVVRDPSKAGIWSDRGAEVAVADLKDTAALTAALHGCEGAFVLNPPAYGSGDMIAEARLVCASIRAAITAADVRRIVGLSSVGAHRSEATGNIRTNHILEEVLVASGEQTSFLRAAWFMENVEGLVGIAQQQGVLPSFLVPLERAIPQVATHDIGRVAADLLTSADTPPRLVELSGPREYAPIDVARVLSERLGQPVKAEVFERRSWPAFFADAGMSETSAQLWAEMIDGFNSGWITFEGDHVTLRGIVELSDVLVP